MKPFPIAAFAGLLAIVSPALASECVTGQSFAANGITVSGAFTRAMLPNAASAGGYFTIDNAGASADTLIGITSPAARKVELHEMKMEGDMMKMAPVEGGIAIPAGGSVKLEPMGYHLMFTEVAAPFQKGECVDIVLSFATAGELPVTLNVGSVAQKVPVTD